MAARLRADELGALIEVSKTVNAHLALDAVLEAVMKVTTRLLGVEASSLVLIDESTHEMIFHIAHGEQADSIKQVRLAAGEGIVGSVIESGSPAIVNDVSQDSHFLRRVDDTSGFQTRSVLCVPLATSDRVWGAIEVLNKREGGAFSERDLAICESIASQAAIAIENARLHSQIVQKERLAAVGETVAGLAHCIKNILNGIRGGAYMVDLALRNQDDNTLMKGWEMVKRNNGFMHDLALDMLAYAKERAPAYQSCEANKIVSNVCETMAPCAREKGVCLEWTENADLSAVVVDPTGIQRCLLNLVGNAIEACPTGQDASVRVATMLLPEERFSISVTDTGCGIPEQDLAKLFQVFFSTKGAKGTGLGLAVTRKIIEEHGGHIAVDSAVDRGTTFTMVLPIEGHVAPNRS